MGIRKRGIARIQHTVSPNKSIERHERIMKTLLEGLIYETVRSFNIKIAPNKVIVLARAASGLMVTDLEVLKAVVKILEEGKMVALCTIIEKGSAPRDVKPLTWLSKITKGLKAP
jgi:3-polyprenyl-4-hydroxybenzoate decarboxylase